MKVLDTPGPCLSIQVKAITLQHVTIVWEPPLNDGGSVITQYIIEKREATRKAWQIAATATYRNLAKVEGLAEGASYFFRFVPTPE